MPAVRPSTVEEREAAVAHLRANREAGRPLFAGTEKLGRAEGTLMEWLRKADLNDLLAKREAKGEADKPVTKVWPKPFWEL